MVLLGNVPVDDAIRLVGVELSRNNQSVVLGTTPAEKQLLERHAAKGKQRSTVGMLVGGAVMGGLWRWSGNKRRVLGMVATISGSVFGMTYGVLSIRRGLFTELLTLPAEQSPFAARARKVLREKIPDNAFVQELRERMKTSAGGFDDEWNSGTDTETAFAQPPEAQKTFPDLPPAPTRVPTPTQAFPSRETAPGANESDGFFSADADTTSGRSPFFILGGRGEADSAKARDRELPPLSRDPYASYPSAGTATSSQTRPSGVVRRDEDEYFFGIPSDEGEAPARATTWEDIRRQAAQREQSRK